jgi:hypothetical protein
VLCWVSLGFCFYLTGWKGAFEEKTHKARHQGGAQNTLIEEEEKKKRKK